MGIIATRSVDTPVLGLKDLMKQHEVRIRNGMIAYGQLQELLAGNKILNCVRHSKQAKKILDMVFC